MPDPAIIELGADEMPADTSVVTLGAETASDEDELPVTAELQDDGSVVLKLNFPVKLEYRRGSTGEVRTEKRTELHFQRLNGEAVTAIMSAGDNRITVGLAKSCGMRADLFGALFKQMDGSDSMAAAQVLNYFLSPGAARRSGLPASP